MTYVSSPKKAIISTTIKLYIDPMPYVQRKLQNCFRTRYAKEKEEFIPDTCDNETHHEG